MPYTRMPLWFTRSPVLHVAIALLILSGCQAPLVTPPAPATPPTTNELRTLAPLPADDALPPVNLAIAALALEAPVIPMGWTVAEVDGARTTQWQVPADALGWHVNSAGVGAAGRLILSGHQAQGAALLKPLALGEIVAGQEIDITDADGLVFVYRVTEVSDPIPLTGATAEDEANAAAYAAPTEQPVLTLVTGWPEFTTTHRVFAVAELMGVRQ